jgi:hypothetical protein
MTIQMIPMMRPREFGGFAYILSRDGMRSMSTWRWLHESRRIRWLTFRSAHE